MSRGLVYTLHLWPPIAHAKHYTGSARTAAPAGAAHRPRPRPRRPPYPGPGRTRRLLGPGPDRARRPDRGTPPQAARRRPQVRGVQGRRRLPGRAAQPGTGPARAGWDRASQHERGLLLDMFGLSQARRTCRHSPAPAGDAGTAARPGQWRGPRIPAPRPAPDVHYQITPEIVALVDQLQQGWTREAMPRPGAQAPQAAAEPEMEPQA